MTKGTFGTLVLLVFDLASPHPQLDGQVSHHTAGRPICDNCQIQLTEKATLGTFEEPGALGGPIAFTKDPDGHIFVVSQETASEIDVFDSAGNPVSVLGKKGEGPGEFRHISALGFAPDGNLWVFDAGLGRLTSFDPETGDVAWISPFRGVAKAVLFLESRGAIVSAVLPSPESIVFPLHFLDQAGNLRMSFGAENQLFRPDMADFLTRHLSLADGGTFWVGHNYQYILERWDLEGEMETEVVRNADWFPPGWRQEPITPDAPPVPEIRAVHFDPPTGFLWVTSRIGSPHWADALGQPESDQLHGDYFPIEDRTLLYNARIEVIDPFDGSLVASRVLEAPVVGSLPGGDLLTYHEGTDGIPRLKVWEFSLISEERR